MEQVPVFKKPSSDLMLYFKVVIFTGIVGSFFYAYTTWLKIPNALNKAVADAAIFIIGCSMILSSICYFWNSLDHMIVYRKHLGVIGFCLGLAHTLLSLPALQALFTAETWMKGAMWPALTGFVALLYFAIMTLISNRLMARMLGRSWRTVLRVGYLAVILVGAHVVLLKFGRWVSWYEGGMKTWPSSSLLVSIWILIVILMRVALWISLKMKTTSKPSP